MATLSPVSITGNWTLVYDASETGTFTGALHTTGEPIGIYIGTSLPSSDSAGFYLVFDHIGQANATKGLFLVAYSEMFS